MQIRASFHFSDPFPEQFIDQTSKSEVIFLEISYYIYVGRHQPSSQFASLPSKIYGQRVSSRNATIGGNHLVSTNFRMFGYQLSSYRRRE